MLACVSTFAASPSTLSSTWLSLWVNPETPNRRAATRAPSRTTFSRRDTRSTLAVITPQEPTVVPRPVGRPGDSQAKRVNLQLRITQLGPVENAG